MLSAVDYASLLQYSPRGTSETSRTSRTVKDTIKAGRIEKFRTRIGEITAQYKDQLHPFLNPDVTLVPVPRSSPIRETDLWPALEIARMLESLGLGQVSSCLIRTTALPKSSLIFNADLRPSVTDQFASLAVNNDVPSASITLVDDVITLGRTSLAAASRLAEKFPNATVRVFSMVLTRGFIDIDNILQVQTGHITYNEVTGKCNREP